MTTEGVGVHGDPLGVRSMGGGAPDALQRRLSRMAETKVKLETEVFGQEGKESN